MQTTLNSKSVAGSVKAPAARPAAVPRFPKSRHHTIAASTPSGEGLTYKKAGVDIDAGDELVKRIQKLNPAIGGFSGYVPFGDSYLVAGTDGVGTKLKLAFDMNKHDTVSVYWPTCALLHLSSFVSC